MKTFRIEYIKPVRHVATQCTVVLSARNKVDAENRFAEIQPDDSCLLRVIEIKKPPVQVNG